MIGEWALQARDRGVRFPTNHHSTIRDGMHRETHESATRYVAKKGDDRNVGDRCIEGRDRRMEGNWRRPPPLVVIVAESWGTCNGNVWNLTMGVEIQMQVQNRGTMGIIDSENHKRNGAYPREGKVPLMDVTTVHVQ